MTTRSTALARQSFRLALGVSSVLVVSAVSGFAQTNTRGLAETTHSSLHVTRAYAPVLPDDFPDVPRASNIRIAPAYRSLVEKMLLLSPTFRRQYLRLAQAATLTVDLVADASRSSRPPAFTTISRSRDRAGLHAVIAIAPSTRAAELIAHEIEHIIEQLDGVDLNDKASIPASGVHECDCGNIAGFETSRAIAAGERVGREVGGRRD